MILGIARFSKCRRNRIAEFCELIKVILLRNLKLISLCANVFQCLHNVLNISGFKDRCGYINSKFLANVLELANGLRIPNGEEKLSEDLRMVSVFEPFCDGGNGDEFFPTILVATLRFAQGGCEMCCKDARRLSIHTAYIYNWLAYTTSASIAAVWKTSSVLIALWSWASLESGG